MPETGERTDPFLAFRFELSVDGLPVGGFSECGGLMVTTEVLDHAEGGLNSYVHKLPTRSRQSTLRLKRGIVDRVLWDWHDALVQGDTRRRNGAIRILDPSGSDVVAEWRFRRAFLVSWTGPDLSATANQIAVESLELAHEGLERGR